jgi:hypothetical protein
MLTADELERCYAAHTSALWRGDPAGRIFEAWLQLHWVTASPARPAAVPAAISPHAAGGRGILWYEASAAILGFVPGKQGCYVVKRTESVPVMVSPTPTHVYRLPEPLPPVAHFQAGSYARHLLEPDNLAKRES